MFFAIGYNVYDAPGIDGKPLDLVEVKAASWDTCTAYFFIVNDNAATQCVVHGHHHDENQQEVKRAEYVEKIHVSVPMLVGKQQHYKAGDECSNHERAGQERE